MDRQEILRREVFLLLDSHFIWMGDLNNKASLQDYRLHPYCYVKLRDGRCFYMVSADLDFPVKMKVSERFALNQWLSSHPDTMSYDGILQVLQLHTFTSGDWGIVPWELVENHPSDYIVGMIEDTRQAFENSADDLMYGVALHSVMEGACDDYE